MKNENITLDNYDENEFIIKDTVLKRYRGNSENVIIPDGVTRIEQAFGRSKIVRNIVIPDSVEAINANAFELYVNLISITIGKGLKSIITYRHSYSSFMNRCWSLETITVSPENPVYHSAGNCLIETATKKLIVGTNSSVIPDDGSVITIGLGAFMGRKILQHIVIPEFIVNIENYAFQECDNLQSITFLNHDMRLGEYAFCNCQALKHIALPNNIKVIEKYTFAVCRNLKSIIIPHTVKFICQSAFAWCQQLKEIVIPNDIEYIGSDAFLNCLNLKKVTMPYHLPHSHEALKEIFGERYNDMEFIFTK